MALKRRDTMADEDEVDDVTMEKRSGTVIADCELRMESEVASMAIKTSTMANEVDENTVEKR